jgi:plastocyanin
VFVLAWQFLKRFFMDPAFAASRLRAGLLAVAAGGYLVSPDIAELFGTPRAQRWAKGIFILLGIIAAAIKAGEKNQSIDEIQAALAARGATGSAVAPTAPPQVFVPPAVLLLLLLPLLALTACSGDAVRAAFGVQPAQAMVGPGELVQYTALAAPAPVTWSVVESGGGSITASGLYAAPACPAAGTFHVVATAGGQSGQATATVADQVKPGGVVVSPANVTLAPGQTQQFTSTTTTVCGAVSSATMNITAPSKAAK